MSKQKIRTLRLHRQEINLEKQPLENAFVKRVDDLKFYYCLYNLQDDFKGGFYFGLLQLHHEYPFAAPKLFMYTPNGRYESNIAICTSFTNYHQESWTSAWNVRTLIQATISFMYANEPSYGCRQDSSQIRKNYARQSMNWNMKDELFVKLFGQVVNEKIKQMRKDNIVEKNVMQSSEIMIEGLQLQPPPLLQQGLIDPRNIEYIPKQQLRQPLIRQNIRQRNQQERKWYKKKWVVICGGLILAASTTAVIIYLKR